MPRPPFRAALAALILSAAPLAAENLKVVTTFTVLADMARNVAGDHADVVSVTKPGAEIHGYQPTPRDLVARTGCRSDPVERAEPGTLVRAVPDQSRRCALGHPVRRHRRRCRSAKVAYEGKANPHAWMSLDNALIYIDNIATALSSADPDNAATYAANADGLQGPDLRAEIEPLRDSLAAVPEDKRWLVSCEGAFSYLARDLGLHEVYLWPINADPAGHAATGAPRHRHRARQRNSGGVLRKHRQHRPRRTGRARNWRGLWRRALRRQPVEPTARCRPISTFCASPPKRWPHGLTRRRVE